MPSPFPGMDPWLEDPGLWPDVHHELISVSRELLNQRLRPKYHVRIEERVYISDDNDPGRSVIIPDLRIRDTENRSEVKANWLADADNAVAEPVVATTLIEEEIREARLEVIDRASRSVVTVIELLSPTNKVPGSRGQASYQQKRQEVMQSHSHFVELDLLREGAGIFVREALPHHDYLVHVSRLEKRPQALLWPILLPQRLPPIPIPLKPEDPDVPLELQTALELTYDRAGYDLEIEYRSEPHPPLPEEYRPWADQLLHVKGQR